MTKKTILEVASMHCGGCVSTVEKAILSVDGVESVKTDLREKRVVINGSVDEKILTDAVSKTGYEAQVLDQKSVENKSLFRKLFRE